jgi:hypothetical protein
MKEPTKIVGSISGLFHVHPLLSFGRFKDGVTDVLGAEGVAEIRVTLLCARVVEGFKELG